MTFKLGQLHHFGRNKEIWTKTTLFTFLFVLFSLVFFFLNPPLQTPDEPQHFIKAYALSEGKIFPIQSPETNSSGKWNSYGFMLEASVNRFVGVQPGKEYQPLPADKAKKIVFTGTAGITNYFVLNYIPQAIGIAAGRVFGASMLTQYYLARFLNLICYLFIIFVAIRLFAFSKLGFGVLALNPVAIFLAASTSGDAMIIAGTFLFVALITRCLAKEKIANYDIMSSGGLLALLVLMKPTLIMLGLLYFLIPNKKLSIPRKLLWGGTILLISVGLYELWNHFMISQQLVYQQFANPKLQTSIFLHHPMIFIDNFVNNFILGNSGVSMQYGPSIFQGTVGTFGWLTVPLQMRWVWLFILLFIFTSLQQEENQPHSTWLNKLIVFVSLFGFVVLTFFALYQIWNQPGSTQAILGVQGRYFIPVSCLVPLLLANKVKHLTISKVRAYQITFVVMMVIIGATAWTLYHAYHFIVFI